MSRTGKWLVVATWLASVGCAGSGPPPPSPTATPPATATRTPTLTATITPTATPTVTPTLGMGANIGFFGVLRADNTLVPPVDFDAAGRPIFTRFTGSGFLLVIDAKPGTNGADVGISTYESDLNDPTFRPDLQIEATRDLGNGTPTVCDNTLGHFGGIPGIDPPDFSETQAITNTLNDFGCRFDDGANQPGGRTPDSACPMFPDGEFRFVDPNATVEFCATITAPIMFPDGDTIVTARVRDLDGVGVVGPARQIVIRIAPP